MIGGKTGDRAPAELVEYAQPGVSKLELQVPATYIRFFLRARGRSLLFRVARASAHDGACRAGIGAILSRSACQRTRMVGRQCTAIGMRTMACRQELQ
jgi:hypothetical protein